MLSILLSVAFIPQIIYFEIRHLNITQTTPITLNLLAIVTQKIGFYVFLGWAIFSPIILVKVLCIGVAFLLKSFHIVLTGKVTNIYRNKRLIGTKKRIFLVIPFLDIIKWEDDS